MVSITCHLWSSPSRQKQIDQCLTPVMTGNLSFCTQNQFHATPPMKHPLPHLPKTQILFWNHSCLLKHNIIPSSRNIKGHCLCANWRGFHTKVLTSTTLAMLTLKGKTFLNFPQKWVLFLIFHYSTKKTRSRWIPNAN